MCDQQRQMRIAKVPRRESSPGFTLMEMLLGLAIFAVLASSLYATFASSLLINKKIRASVNYYATVSDTMDLLARELENAVAYQQEPADGISPSGFYGTESRMRFLLATDQGLREVQYYLLTPDESTIHRIIVGKVSKKNVPMMLGNSKGNRVQWLVREERAFVPGQKDDPEIRSELEVLSRQVEEGTLKFFYAFHEKGQAPGELSWRSDWQEKYFPAGVRMTVTFSDPQSGEPPLVFDRDFFVPLGVRQTETSTSAEEK